ncbi:Fc receptor-like protein 2 [Leptodactylus fuscus]
MYVTYIFIVLLAFISHARIRYYLGPDLSVQQLQYDITSSAHEDLFQSKKLHIYPVLCTLIMGNSGDILRPTVSCSPWNHIYSGDSVTLQCDIGQNKNIDGYYFYWYKDNKELRQHQRKHKFTIQKANSYDTGVYECWSGSGERSHPLSLYVIYRDKDRPSVTFRPNYRSIFVGETMEMSCDLRSSTSPFQDYVWYKDIEELMIGQKYIIQRATVNDTGNYRYEKGRGANYPVRLDVYYQHKVILQTPPDIVEGDSLDMRCHSSPGRNEEKDTTFYKDGAIIQLSGHILHLPNVKKSMSGIYRCEKIIPNEGLLKTEETFVFVQEGHSMTLRCDTRRNPLREDTELQFIFYRNGQIVQNISSSTSSSTYTVQPAQLEDSGNYTCEVRTPSDTVMKMSDTSYISITELFSKPELQIDPEMVQEGDNVTIKCGHTLSYKYNPITFYKDSQVVQYEDSNDEYVIPSASEDDTGNYKCSLLYGGIYKNSSEIKVLVHAAVNKPHLMLSPNKVVMGDDIVLRCESTKGSLPIYYQFYHSHTLLGNVTIHQKEAAELPMTITSVTMDGNHRLENHIRLALSAAIFLATLSILIYHFKTENSKIGQRCHIGLEESSKAWT